MQLRNAGFVQEYVAVGNGSLNLPDDGKVWGTNMERKNAQYEAAAIKSIDVKSDCGDLIVSEAEDLTLIQIEAKVDEEDAYEEYVDNGVLKIRCKWKQRWFNVGKNKVCIYLRIPKAKRFEDFSLEVGAGNAELLKPLLSCERMQLEVGAGNINITEAEITDKLDVEIGTGNIKLQRASVKNIRVECGVGDCYLGLTGKEADYNYNISCGVGKIQVNDNCMKQIGGSETRRNADAVGNIELECGVGRIELHTAE